MIALPLFALGAANILSGLGLVRMQSWIRKMVAAVCFANFLVCGLFVYLFASDISRHVGGAFEVPLMLLAALVGIACAAMFVRLTFWKGSQQLGGGAKWTLLNATAAVLVLGGVFGLWLFGSFLALGFGLALQPWLLGKAPLDAAMVFFGTAILASPSRLLIREPFIAAVCGASIVLYAGDLWSYWDSSTENDWVYRLLDALGMFVNLCAVALLAFSYLQRRSTSLQTP